MVQGNDIRTIKHGLQDISLLQNYRACDKMLFVERMCITPQKRYCHAQHYGLFCIAWSPCFVGHDGGADTGEENFKQSKKYSDIWQMIQNFHRNLQERHDMGRLFRGTIHNIMLTKERLI